VSDHSQKHRPATTADPKAAQQDDPNYVAGGGVNADRAWAQERIRNHFAARRDPAFVGSLERPAVVQRKATYTGDWRQRLRGGDDAPIFAKREEQADAPPGEQQHEVSQPGEPAEQEADAVADHVADKLHGDEAGDREGEGGAPEDAGQQKAPEIGAKLDGVGLKVFRAKDDKLTGKTPHAEDRKKQGQTDPHRQVGDANRVVHAGRKFEDAETGNIVYVNGDRVVITDKKGKQITQFKNTRANTQARIRAGKWKPIS